ADDGGDDHGLLRRVEAPLGPVYGGPLPLADAAALGRGVRHLPAHQPGGRVLVGFGVDLLRAGHRRYLGPLDVGADAVLLPGRGATPAGRAAGEDYPVARITETAKPAAGRIPRTPDSLKAIVSLPSVIASSISRDRLEMRMLAIMTRSSRERRWGATCSRFRLC